MMTEQDRYTELYETWCRVDLINLIIKLEAANRRQQNGIRNSRSAVD